MAVPLSAKTPDSSSQGFTHAKRLNPVFRSLNAPLTLLGAERKLFFFALVIGAAVFNLLHTFLGGLFMFALLYLIRPLGDED